MPRPICVHCAKPYGRRAVDSETIRWPHGEEMPAYVGNGVIVKTTEPREIANRDTIRKVTAWSVNPDIRAAQEQQIASAPEQRRMVATRWVWDGETWVGGYDPFCTLRCALDYARAAYARARQPALRRVR